MTTPKITAKKRESSTIAVATAKVGDTAVVSVGGKRARPAVKSVKAPVEPKPKLIRDSFTIPKPEYAVLDALKLRAANLMRPTKKSEVLRAGIFALNAMSDEAFLATLNSVPSLKTGRPKNSLSVGRSAIRSTLP